MDPASVDAIVAGQAFHWFDREASKKEFGRILKPGGWAALIWNERLVASDFEKEYDQLILRHARDYVQVDHRQIDLEKIQAFFLPAQVIAETFPNVQEFDYTGLEGRLLSSSYMPAKNEPAYGAMAADLRALFERYKDGQGRVAIHYATKVFAGQWPDQA